MSNRQDAQHVWEICVDLAILVIPPVEDGMEDPEVMAGLARDLIR